MKQFAKTSKPRVFQFKPVEHNPFVERMLYIIRHGSTDLNSENGGVDRIRGWHDVPLSEKGQQEVKTLGEELADSGIQLLIHSDLQRARDTAQAVANATDAQLVPTAQLRPWNLGEFTGKNSNEAHPQIMVYADKHPDKPVPGGESFNQFKERIFDALREINQRTLGKRIGIVTHHRVERLINAWKEAGETTDHKVDLKVMFERGEKPGTAQMTTINMHAL